MSEPKDSLDSSAIRDSIIATEIVKTIFHHINLCLEKDRSKVKLNLFEKGIIKGMLSEKTLNGVNGYILRMFPQDVKILIDDIEDKISKRKK